MVGNDREQILLTVRRVLVEQSRLDIDDIQENTHLVHDIGFDSLDIVEIIILLEDKYGIWIPDEDASNVSTTVKDIVDYLVKAVM